jgi:hypothetical protein
VGLFLPPASLAARVGRPKDLSPQDLSPPIFRRRILRRRGADAAGGADSRRRAVPA